MRIALVVGVIAALLYGPAEADYADREDVQAFIQEMVSTHGFDKAELVRVFQEAEQQPKILESIARPAEKALKWFEYRRIFMQEKRIDRGIEFWEQNAAALDRALKQFDVSPEYVVGIIGVETLYGQNVGSYRVVDALATLGFDYPPRATFFRRELSELLLLAREEETDPLDLKGSYAGAMGFGQFIPSSYRAYAIDFDGDGKRDIWTNIDDAIGSVASYLARHGWKGQEPVVLQVGEPTTKAMSIVNEGFIKSQTVAVLKEKGVEFGEDDLDVSGRAALYRMDLEEGAEYWAGLNDFYVITRYNRSPMYALAVHQLSQEIKTRREQQLAARQ
ncbi:MAG: lytic murein transglycosylase B [Proteobacteria bacterium]|nr:lytic murein transglycosylase B [Pseudomonadota bacterium]